MANVGDKEKTLVLWNQCEGDILFFELEGDYRHLDGVFLNSDGEEHLHDELNDILNYDDKGQSQGVTMLTEPTKDWDYFVQCGFIP